MKFNLYAAQPQMRTVMKLTDQEIYSLVGRVGVKMGDGICSTYPPIFPEGRDDVAAIAHHPVNVGSRAQKYDKCDYGFTQVFAVAKTAEGELRYCELAHSRETKNTLLIKAVSVEEEILKVEIRDAGDYSEEPLEKIFEIPLKGLGL